MDKKLNALQNYLGNPAFKQFRELDSKHNHDEESPLPKFKGMSSLISVNPAFQTNALLKAQNELLTELSKPHPTLIPSYRFLIGSFVISIFALFVAVLALPQVQQFLPQSQTPVVPTKTDTSLADPVSDAKIIFTRYCNLEASFDSNFADLYSDDALIKNKRTYPTGQVREVTLPARKYKQLIRTTMPLAKLKGDYSTYSDVKFEKVGNAVRVSAKRFSVLKKYYSPIYLLIAPTQSVNWLIIEEFSESRPNT